MPQAPAPGPAPLTDADLDTLQDLLAGVPAPLEPLDVMALDGYLCGVLLQPRDIPAAQWLPMVLDIDGRPAPAGYNAGPLATLAQRRHAELQRAIAQRDWFDPWIFPVEEPDEDADNEAPHDADKDADKDDADDETGAADAGSPSTAVLPWVAGFAAALDAFPALMALGAPELVEPLALVYLHFDPTDLEDADALAAVIDTIEPPTDLAEAVQDLVRAVMLIADVTRPRRPTPTRRTPPAVRRGPPPRGRR